MSEEEKQNFIKLFSKCKAYSDDLGEALCNDDFNNIKGMFAFLDQDDMEELMETIVNTGVVQISQ